MIQLANTSTFQLLRFETRVFKTGYFKTGKFKTKFLENLNLCFHSNFGCTNLRFSYLLAFIQGSETSHHQFELINGTRSILRCLRASFDVYFSVYVSGGKVGWIRKMHTYAVTNLAEHA